MIINYIASSGNNYALTVDRIRTKSANLHAWTFEPEATKLRYGERISDFHKDAAAYQFKLIITGGPTQRKAILDALHDDFENDVRNLTPGRVTFGDWYCDCYITASSTAPGSVSHWTENEITVYVPSGFWIRQESHTFSPQTPSPTGFLKYDYDYNYDYTPPALSLATWNAGTKFESKFIMKIYGPCTNPLVTINGHPYLVRVSVSSGETLVINSANNTVMLGNVNAFDDRDKENSVFAPIPPGALSVEYGKFSFDLTLLEERSEPKW